MLDQNTFRETLHLVQRVAASSDQPMSREEALSYFQDMELSPEQQALLRPRLLWVNIGLIVLAIASLLLS